MAKLLDIWYSIAAPTEPAMDAPLYKREIVRRARIISLILLLTLFLAALPLPFSPMSQVIPTLIAVLIFDVIALMFNRAGKITIAGWVIVVSTQTGLAIAATTSIFRGGVELSTFELICLFVQPVVVAASVLRPRQSFAVLLINIILIPIMVQFAPHAVAFNAYLHQTGPQSNQFVYVIPFTVLTMSYFGLLIWVISANAAIYRAYQADRKIKYIEAEAYKAQIENEQKKYLERDVFELQGIISAIANDASKPIHIREENKLRPLALVLELMRKRALQTAYEQQQHHKLAESVELLSAFLESEQPLQSWQHTNTQIDHLAYILLKDRLKYSSDTSQS